MPDESVEVTPVENSTAQTPVTSVESVPADVDALSNALGIDPPDEAQVLIQTESSTLEEAAEKVTAANAIGTLTDGNPFTAGGLGPREGRSPFVPKPQFDATGLPDFDTLFGDLGKGFDASFHLKTTNQRVSENIGAERDNTPPPAIQPWEMRLGGCKFYVPPISIRVQRSFKSGSLAGAALRQPQSPKFNTGHSETMVSMSLYFPNYKEVFGFDNRNFKSLEDELFEIDFDEDDDEKIDRFLSSLRGLIAQFKFAPFLPVENAYLNQVHGISGVVLKNMSISTNPEFPFAVQVDLMMYRFNHKVYLPMIENFSQAVHWGRYRQYMGRAAARLAESVRPLSNFVDAQTYGEQIAFSEETLEQGIEPSIATVEEVLGESSRYAQSQAFGLGGSGYQGFKRHTYADANTVDFYFPFHSPAGLELPDLDDLQPDTEALGGAQVYNQDGWNEFLGFIGLTDPPPEANFDKVSSENENGYIHNHNEYELLVDFFSAVGVFYTAYNPGAMEQYIQRRISELNPSDEGAGQIRQVITEAWFYALYRFLLEDTTIATEFVNQQRSRRYLNILEWELPMWKLGLDPDKVKVQGVTVSIGNRIAKLQLQLQDEPTYQHIGGEDATISMTMTVLGESELIKLRTMFDTISGLARIEHSHGVLGFLGIQNVVTELYGIRYVIPIDFVVDTIPNYPHAYQVSIMMTDFDIFQQKRETLSYNQQAEIATAFTKQNPFFRIKQLWGYINPYPDFPLEVRDEERKVVGHLNPDYMFRHFRTVDPDIVAIPGSETSSRGVDNAQLITNLGNYNGEDSTLYNNYDGFSLYNGDTPVVTDAAWHDVTTATSGQAPVTPNAAPASAHMAPYFGSGGDPSYNYSMMGADTLYRDKAGQMIRAYPTFMLWLINEGGTLGTMKLFDNFYGLQSVIDFSIVQSEDMVGDTMILRLSNLYGRLSTRFRDYLEEKDPGARIINTLIKTTTNTLAAASNNYVLRLDTIDLRPGARIHMRMGYGGNPNQLDTVFNGTVTEVQEGDILTITCQSDGVELTAPVNPTDEKGHTGKIDGSMVGLYLSEPRDLMLALLSNGSGVVRESIAQATKGAVFSENRYGIRHFGMMLYSPLNEEEVEIYNERSEHLVGKIEEYNLRGENNVSREGQGVSSAVIDVLNGMWANLHLKRDFEIFKRNIYPGNGTGIAQFLGGDIDAAGLTLAVSGTQAAQSQDGDNVAANIAIERAVENLYNDPADIYTNNDQPRWAVAGDHNPFWFGIRNTAAGGAIGALGGPIGIIAGVTAASVIQYKSLRGIMGITSDSDDDAGPFDEVAFRASTYMSTVWDLFKVCAALLPDYIVAIRPFEERSTIFYGKPHWLYTSELVPLTTGAFTSDAPPIVEPDEFLFNATQKIEEAEATSDRYESFEAFAAVVGTYDPSQSFPGSSDPNSSSAGLPGGLSSGETAANAEFLRGLPVTSNSNSSARLEHTEGKAGLEMHLPTNADLQTDMAQHKHHPTLPDKYKHPFYMDRADPGNAIRGGYVGLNTYDPNKRNQDQAILKGEERYTDKGGKSGASGFLNPDEEIWYCNMQWQPRGSWRGNWDGERILIYCEETNRAIICIAREWGPAGFVVNGGKVAGVSPDAYWHLIGEDSSKDTGTTPQLIFRVWPNRQSGIGPVQMGVSGGSSSGQHDSGISVAVDSHNQNQSSVTTNPSNSGPTPTNESSAPAVEVVIPDEYADLSPEEVGAFVSGIPVNPEGFDPIPFEGGVSEGIASLDVGSIAAQTYQPRSDSDANKIWDEFRKYFRVDQETRDAFLSHPAIAELPEEAQRAIAEEAYDRAVDDFQTFLWTNGFRRGWLARVANKRPGELTSLLDFDLNTDDGFWTGVGSFIGEAGQWIGAAVDNVVTGAVAVGGSVIDAIIPGGEPGEQIAGVTKFTDDRTWSYGPAYTAFAIFIVQGEAGARDYMLANASVGRDLGGYLGYAAETIGRAADTALDSIGKVLNSVTGLFSGVLNFFKLSMNSLANGIMLQTSIQQQTNVMNRMLNDSLYFNAGRSETGALTNPLLYYADNPFTREYGEPVIEVRKPFQRFHMIGSFQHIINNGIIETNANVANVITAISQDQNPTTVHFDKSLSSEKQFERVVETGLVPDMPDGAWNRTKASLNPLNAARWTMTHAGWFGPGNGTPSDMSAKRVALSHLKESLKDIYQGELIVIGDSAIRPYDVVFLGDVYSRMYGAFEVEQVVHHFTPETGFITSITPNAIVSVNDPARFSLLATWRNRAAMQDLRNNLRQSLKVQAAGEAFGDGPLTIGNYEIDTRNNNDVRIEQLVNRAEEQVYGSRQFSGGGTNLVKNIAGIFGSGSFGQATLRVGGLTAAAAFPVLGQIGLGVGFGAWKAWEWVRDNLLDQHGCTISYLTKDGQAMDAGMSYNQGVAVGQTDTVSFMLGGLRIKDFDLPDANGDTTIRMDDVVHGLEWDEYGPNDAAQQIDMFVDVTVAQARALLEGVTAIPGAIQFDVYWCRVIQVIDGDTIDVNTLGRLNLGIEEFQTGNFELGRIRLNGIDSPEDPFKNERGVEGTEEFEAGGTFLEKEIIETVIDNTDGTHTIVLGGDSPYNAIVSNRYQVRIDKTIDTFTVVPGEFLSEAFLVGPSEILSTIAAETQEDYVFVFDATNQSPQVDNTMVLVDKRPDVPIESDNINLNAGINAGTRATQYAIDNLLGKYVAIRVDPAEPTDLYDRTLGYIFHNAPASLEDEESDLTSQERRRWLLNAAGKSPAIPWTAFLDDGRPYTFNWEMVIKGHANNFLGDLERDEDVAAIQRN